MLFVRIAEAGYNTNGNHRFKVYIYKPAEYQQGQYEYLSIEEMKNLDFGRVYKEQHYILTVWEKWEILEKMEKTYEKENFVYIFE